MKSFRIKDPSDVNWSNVIYLTKTSRKEAGYFSLVFLLLGIVSQQLGVTDYAIGSVIAGLFSLAFFVYAIRYLYLVIRGVGVSK